MKHDRKRGRVTRSRPRHHWLRRELRRAAPDIRKALIGLFSAALLQFLTTCLPHR